MKIIIAFFKLIRFANLIFIFLTQFIFFNFIIKPLSYSFLKITPFNYNNLILLTTSSVLIAAAGNIINDYFDLNIDIINKPQKLILNRLIKHRWAIIWHWILSAIGVSIGLYLAVTAGQWIIAFSNIICVIILWFYSTTFKKQLLSGNIIISLLTAWVILVYFIYFAHYNPSNKLFKFTALYASFAFIITLIREVVKDMEDIDGDSKYNCHTMPIAWGISTTKVFIAVWLIVLIGALTILQFYAWYLGWYYSIIYCICLLIIPLIWILIKIKDAQISLHYHQISSAIKFVMLAGILSMIFIKYYS